MVLSVWMLTGVHASGTLPARPAAGPAVTAPPAKITVKLFKQLTGRKPTLKERIGLMLYNTGLVKFKKNGDEEKGARYGQTSLLTALAGWGLLIVGAVAAVPVIGIGALVLFVFSIVYGIKGLSLKKGDTKSIIGIVLSGLYFLLLIAAIIAVISFFA